MENFLHVFEGCAICARGHSHKVPAAPQHERAADSHIIRLHHHPSPTILLYRPVYAGDNCGRCVVHIGRNRGSKFGTTWPLILSRTYIQRLAKHHWTDEKDSNCGNVRNVHRAACMLQRIVGEFTAAAETSNLSAGAITSRGPIKMTG